VGKEENFSRDCIPMVFGVKSLVRILKAIEEYIMRAMERLSSHVKNRLVDLGNAKHKGRKVIGYHSRRLCAEELLLACGAMPLGLIQGGDHVPVELAGGYICRWIDTFCRAQIGYGVSGDNPYYNIIDMLVIPVTDNHIRAISDVLTAIPTSRYSFWGCPIKKTSTLLPTIFRK